MKRCWTVQYEAKATEMGEGVKLVNVAEVKRKDGATGVRVDYAFSDITKLKVEAGSPKSSGGGPGMEQPEKKSKPMTFAFVPGTPARLTITMPPDEKPAKDGGGSEEKSEPEVAAPGVAKGKSAESHEDKAMETMMKNMLKDFRLNLRIKVDGEIQKTNASFVRTGSINHKKQYVTLFDIDFGKIIDDPKYADKLAGLDMMSGGESDAAKAMLKGLPGIQIETEKKVEIEFQ